MKRSFALSLCAVALMACTASAQVNVQLNLRYTDPADPTEGGTWELSVQTDTAGSGGVAGIQAVLSGVTGVTGVNTGNVFPNNDATTAVDSGRAPLDGPFVTTGPDPSVFLFQPLTAGIEVVAGDDLQGPLQLGVGLGTVGAQADDLFPGNTTFDGFSLIASGEFGAVRPDIVSVAANEFDGGGAAVAATIGTLSVRGDALNTLGIESPAGAGLVPGDLNRDGLVSPADLGILGANFDPLGTTANYGDGDVNDDGQVGPADLGVLGANFDPLGNNVIPPAASAAAVAAATAVPEPSSAALLMLAAACATVRRRV